MTDTIKALADAARLLVAACVAKDSKWESTNPKWVSVLVADDDARFRAAKELHIALAAYDAAQAQPAPTEAEIESAVVEFGSAKFWQGEAMWSPTDITEDGELLDRRSLEAKANLLFLIARLRGGAR